MAWVLTEKAQAFEPLPGVPWQAMSDREFERVAKAYAERNGFEKGALAASGFFEKAGKEPSSATDEQDGQDGVSAQPAASYGGEPEGVAATSIEGDQEVTHGAG